MMMIQVVYRDEEVKEKAPLKKAREGDAGFDLYNASGQTITLPPRGKAQIDCGIRIKIPDNFCGFIRQRSSTFKKRGIFIVDGLIDSGYTGPIYTIAWHPCLDGHNMPIYIKPWERLSQLIIVPSPFVSIQDVECLPETERGEKGFGSTGN